MFSKIRLELKGIKSEIRALASTLRITTDALQLLDRGGVDSERLTSLEGRIEVILGEVAAGVIKSDALKHTALAAEDRARGHMKRAQGYAKLVEELEGGEEIDSFEAIGGAYAAVVPSGNDDQGEEGELSPMSTILDSRRAGREIAKAAKRRR